MFTKENHPELMDKPLKGDMLREFIRYVSSFGDARKLGLSTSSPAFQNPLSKTMASCARRITHAIDEKIKADNTDQYSLSMNGLMVLMGEQLQQKVDDVDFDATMDELRLNGPNEKLLEKLVVPKIRAAFSMALAVQLGKEKELLKLHAEEAKKDKIKIIDSLESPMVVKIAKDKAQSLAEAVMLGDQEIKMFRKQRSKLADLREQMAYGINCGASNTLDFALETYLESVNGVDIYSTAGQQQVKSQREALMNSIGKYFGVPTHDVHLHN